MSSKINSLRARVEADSLDASAYEQLLGELNSKHRGPERTKELRKTYEDVLSAFPTAVRYRAPLSAFLIARCF
jgi:hypothetical protein